MQICRLLILDDSSIVRHTISALAIELGLTVIEAASAEAARILFAAGDIDILLSDDDLGAGLSGTDLIKSRLPKPPSIMVLMSGNPIPDDLPEGVRFLSKPFTIGELEVALGR